MSWQEDPLYGVERVAFAEEISSAMRHATRNKLAVIRNASTYVHRRLHGTEAWKADPRIETFYKMMNAELEDANDLLEPRELMTHVFERRMERVDASECVRVAVASARLPEAACKSIDAIAESGWVTADARELALAVRCLVENAGEALGGGGGVRVRGGAAGAEYVIEVADEGPGAAEGRFEQAFEPFFTTKEGHVGLGLNIARRIARRCRGELRLGPSMYGRFGATLSLPLRGEGPEP